MKTIVTRQGLRAIASAIGGRVENNRLDEAESRGKAAGESAYAPIVQALAGKGTADIGTLTGALSNEWLNPGQRSIAQSLLQRHLETTDPMYGLRKRKAELEIDSFENPKPKYHNKGLDVGSVVRTNELGGPVKEVGAPPEGVTPEEWKAMSPEERAQWK